MTKLSMTALSTLADLVSWGPAFRLKKSTSWRLNGYIRKDDTMQVLISEGYAADEGDTLLATDAGRQVLRGMGRSP